MTARAPYSPPMNVRAPYLPLEEARDYVSVLGKAWNSGEMRKVAHAEGWNIFNLSISGDGDSLDAGIAKYDDIEEWDNVTTPIEFEDDQAVINHCIARAAAGSEAHHEALQIEHALNSVRFHLWGEKWVDSRLGPPDWRRRSSR